ncbi:hypothetical protein QYE76_012451 [Lolium multiflorum]|uniref:Uncharacterized protein n=1 Tax=Lolium multiflorum TaxID=4521 RepID=A0AAD8U104_LOLMU|nr:hypothetical protein QYE76_012451 [Lolium multiflorum]
MSRPHQPWMYVGKEDKSRVSSADLSDEELRDEVRRLTRFSQKDNIVLSSARLPYDLKHLPAEPIYATVDVVADFADQFTRLESENVQLRKTIKISVDQVLEANKHTANVQNENILLKDELKKLKKKMKDEHDARREAAIAADKKEGALRESITNLLSKFLCA